MTTSRQPLRLADAILDEDVIVNKPNSPMHKRIGQIWKVRTDESGHKVSVSFDGHIYNFALEGLRLA